MQFLRSTRARLVLAALSALGLLSAASGCALNTTALGDSVWVASGDSPAPNSGIVKTPFGPVVIDGQPNASAGASLIQAAQKTTGFKDVPYLVLTSHHADHTLSNELFLRAEIVSTDATRAALLDKSDAERKMLHDRLGVAGTGSPEAVPPTMTFEKALTLHAGWPKEKVREIRLVAMPAGAAPGNSVALLPKEKVLFAGDLVTNGVFPYMGDADLAGWLAALDEIEKLDFDRLVPGHGAPGARELVGSTRKLLLDLSRAVGKARAAGEKREEAAKKLDLARYEKWPGYKELLPIAVERLWDQRLPEGAEAAPGKPEVAPSPAPAPAPMPAPAPAQASSGAASPAVIAPEKTGQ